MQDRLRESGKLVWELLEAGGHFYVCGDAAHMAGAVERELLKIIEAHMVSWDCCWQSLCSICLPLRWQLVSCRHSMWTPGHRGLCSMHVGTAPHA